MSVRYKFKNTISQYETISFNDESISVLDFKKKVVQLNHLSKSDDDLKVVNADSKQEFKNADGLIPKNTTLIVSRIPITPRPNKAAVAKRALATVSTEFNQIKTNNKSTESLDKAIVDLSKLNITEEKKIEMMMKQSTAAYNHGKYSAPAPKSYRCNRCYTVGHWLRDCPVASMGKLASRIDNNGRWKTGVPRSFQEKEKDEKENILPKSFPQDDKSKNVPADLLCSICKEIFVDAVMIPCCGSSFCDDCVRSALLESENNVCPSCGEKGASPDSLIPNRYLRKSVNTFWVVTKTDSKLLFKTIAATEGGFIPGTKEK